MNIMEHGEYTAQIEYQAEEGNFFGKVLFINDIVTFEGTSVPELKQAFKDSIEAYIEFCDEFNKEPEKPFSGKMTLRMPCELHKELSKAAIAGDYKSLNNYIVTTLEENLNEAKHEKSACSKCEHSSRISDMQNQILRIKTAYTSIPSQAMLNTPQFEDTNWSNSVQ